MKKRPGIFNDVIGPVMRGPSSSHTAAAWRAARMALDILNEPLKSAVIDFDKDGAWAPNYREQGTTLGIEGGLLNVDLADDRMKEIEKVALELGISIRYEVNSFKTAHPNTFRLQLEGIHQKQLQIVAVSLGGGSVEIISINGVAVKMAGDCHELLLYAKDNQDLPETFYDLLENANRIEEIAGDCRLINAKFSKAPPSELLVALEEMNRFDQIVRVAPVTPIVSGNERELPFTSVSEMLRYAAEHTMSLGDIGLLYEEYQSGLEPSQVVAKMDELVQIIEGSIDRGLQGTQYEDRLLPQQSHLIAKAAKEKQILEASIVNEIIENVSAIMEAKSAMEVVVANPTAGSCGVVGGVLRAVSKAVGATRAELLQAYFAAGVIGVYFAEGPGFSAEEHGCQVECGASAGRAAAGIVQLFGGTAKQGVDAASMAIQNMIGLICDPIADRVEAPCLGKNVSAAVNALSSATMSRAGFNALIPLDEVIETVSRVSLQMPSCNKCTGKGGLAITKTACALKAKMTSKVMG